LVGQTDLRLAEGLRVNRDGIYKSSFG
jgi:hypothetical protein